MSKTCCAAGMVFDYWRVDSKRALLRDQCGLEMWCCDEGEARWKKAIRSEIEFAVTCKKQIRFALALSGSTRPP